MQEQQGRVVRIQESFHIFICQAQSPPTMRSGREQGGCSGGETRHRAYISVRCLSAAGCSMTCPIQRWHTRRRRPMRDASCGWTNAASCWPTQVTAESYVMFTHWARSCDRSRKRASDAGLLRCTHRIAAVALTLLSATSCVEMWRCNASPRGGPARL